nr:uncharacterized protein LOC123769429 [Procambarus clarkii]
MELPYSATSTNSAPPAAGASAERLECLEFGCRSSELSTSKIADSPEAQGCHSQSRNPWLRKTSAAATTGGTGPYTTGCHEPQHPTNMASTGGTPTENRSRRMGRQKRDITTHGIPSRDITTLGIPSRDITTLGIPSRDITTLGIPSRDITTHGIPSRDITTHGIPSRDITTHGIPSRDITTHGIPSGDITTHGIPSRDITTHGIPSRDITTHGIPSRDITTHGIPSRDITIIMANTT